LVLSSGRLGVHRSQKVEDRQHVPRPRARGGQTGQARSCCRARPVARRRAPALLHLLFGGFQDEDQRPLGGPLVVAMNPDARPECVVEPELVAMRWVELAAKPEAEGTGARGRPVPATVEPQRLARASARSVTHTRSKYCSGHPRRRFRVPCPRCAWPASSSHPSSSRRRTASPGSATMQKTWSSSSTVTVDRRATRHCRRAIVAHRSRVGRRVWRRRQCTRATAVRPRLLVAWWVSRKGRVVSCGSHGVTVW
jgi:hypothetical protein